VFLDGLVAGLGATLDVKALADLVAPFFAVVFMSIRPCPGSVAGKYTAIVNRDKDGSNFAVNELGMNWR